MNSLVRAALGRPVSTLMVFLAFVIVAFLAASTLGVSALPEVRVPKLVVSASYPGLPAQEVRTLVTIPLEDALSSVRGLKHLESISREGGTTVTLEFQWGTDLRVAGVEVRESLDSAQSSLPADTKKPLVLPVDPSDEPLAVVGVYPISGDLTLAKRLSEKELRTRLQQVKGVGSVVVVGGSNEEVLVSVDRSRLQARSLTMTEVTQILASSNYDYPAGTLTEAGNELVVKAQGSVSDPEALGRLYAAAPASGQSASTPFQIRDVADIRLSSSDPISSFTRNGKAGVGLYVHKQPGAGPVETVDAVKVEVQRLARDYGQDLEIQLEFDGTGAVRESLSVLTWDALLGVLVAFAVVFLFVRDPASAFIIVISVPLALILTMGFLKATGRTLNLFSLGGLALSIGMMVDHTVVVLENLHKRVLAAGGKTSALVTAATTELSLSNVGATGTAVIVFLPIVFLPGVVGSVFTDLSLAVIGAHVFSFLVSITLVPALFLLLPVGLREKHGSDRMMGRLRSGYLGLLIRVIRRPWRLAVGILGLTAAGVAALVFLRAEYFPELDEGVIDLEVVLPYGTTLQKTAATAQDLELRAAQVAGVQSAYSRVGGEDDDAYYHADPNERPELIHTRLLLTHGGRPRAAEIAETLRQSLHVENATVEVGLPTSPVVRLLGVESGQTRYLVTGNTPETAATRARDWVGDAGDKSVHLFPDGSRPEWHFQPDRPLVAQAGADLYAIAEALRDGVDGVVSSKLTMEGRDIDIRVRMRKEDRETVELVKQFPVKGRSGLLVSVGDLGHLAEVDSQPAYYRYDRADAVAVSVRSSDASWSAKDRPSYLRSPSDEIAREQTGTFLITFALILVLLYLFLGAQLESFSLPLLIMSAIPLSFSGIFLTLFLAGNSINFSSLLGVVALFGVVINNSILLYQMYRDSTSNLWIPTVVGGSLARLRPILMTSLITVFSLAPIAFDPQGSGETGMALALIGGLTVSATLTLFVVPLLFLPGFRKKEPPRA